MEAVAISAQGLGVRLFYLALRNALEHLFSSSSAENDFFAFLEFLHADLCETDDLSRDSVDRALRLTLAPALPDNDEALNPAWTDPGFIAAPVAVLTHLYMACLDPDTDAGFVVRTTASNGAVFGSALAELDLDDKTDRTTFAVCASGAALAFVRDPDHRAAAFRHMRRASEGAISGCVVEFS